MSDIPIGDHAFLADGCTSALVTRDGSVDWLGLPRFDSTPVLARLLDDDAGHLLLRPAHRGAVPTRRYLPKSLVLETTWVTPTGRLVVLDALALGDHERGHDIGIASPGVLLRTAECVEGQVEVELEWCPRPEFGLVHPRYEAVPGGVLAVGGPTQLLLSLDTAAAADDDAVRARVPLRSGSRLAIALQQADSWAAAPTPWSARRIHDRMEETRRAWSSWSDLHQTYRGPFEREVHRSGLVLQGLMHAGTGAIVAAATTSLPEGVGTARTWDYRFTWVRDASMTMRGLWVAACPDEAARFFGFLARAAGTQLERGLPLQIMYGVAGERDLTERELGHLSGWRGSTPVRVGNGAWNQRQQDVYGALLDAAWLLREQLGELDLPLRRLLIAAVETAAAVWQDPDQGLWEVRGPARRYLHSALMCWTALDRGIALAAELGAEDRLERWRAERARIAEAVLQEGWSDRAGAFSQYFGGEELDAATLLIGLNGLIAPNDPRMLATIDAVRDRLTDAHGLVLRYRGDDGLEGEEGSFVLCTFWLAEAMARAGRTEEAGVVLARGVSCANDLGLLAEQVDGATGELLGNFPQAFSHLGLVLAAQALAEADPRLTG